MLTYCNCDMDWTLWKIIWCFPMKLKGMHARTQQSLFKYEPQRNSGSCAPGDVDKNGYNNHNWKKSLS